MMHGFRWHGAGIALLSLLLVSGPLRAAALDWEPDVYPRANLFPSLVIGTARVDPDEHLFASWGKNHQGDPQGIVGASIAGLRKGDTFTLVLEANDFMKESRHEGSVDRTIDGDLVVHPKVSYLYDRLLAVNQVTPLDISMELFVNGTSQGKKSLTVTLRSINDCLFGVAESDDEEDNSDYSWLFSAYVNENHPWVDQLLKEALQTGIVSSFDGYQSGSAETVLQQIFAIWNVMQQHGMKYSDITTTAAESDGIYSQHVRLFDQSVNAAQANCVDGTVLLAALLRKIGLRPSLAVIPGHMFLAVDLDDDTTIGLETTLIGEKDLASPSGKIVPYDSLPQKIRKAAWASFEGAVDTGTEEYEKNTKKFDSDDLEYQLIDLEAAREMGILPIRFNGH